MVCKQIIIKIDNLTVSSLSLELPIPIGTGQAIAYVACDGFGSGNIKIDWGDGKSDTFLANGAGTYEMSHLYANSNTYTVCADVI